MITNDLEKIFKRDIWPKIDADDHCLAYSQFL